MRLLALGVDHRSAPTAIREALAFDGPRRDRALEALRADFPDTEFVLVSTCNRVEVYAAGADDADRPEVDALADWLARFHSVEPATLAGHLVAHHDEAVVGHLFRVAASLESLVLGEGQILGQVRDAYKAAAARKAVGPIFHALFQQALRVGKLVREQTGMDQGKLSVASVAVEVARSVFDTFGDKTVLVIGAGKMGDLTLQHLAELRPGRILITNRNPARAEAAASRWIAKAVPFERLDDALTEADLVVSTTAAEEPVVALDRYARLQQGPRRNRLALILDIAVPRDFDPRIGELDQVLLYNVDDLRAQVERNLAGRRRRVEPAQAIIERETAACLAELRHQHHAAGLLRQLGDYGDSIARRELEKFFAACPDLSDDHRRAAEHLVHRLKNQFLHHPRTALRSPGALPAPGRDDPHPLISAVRHLFGLEGGPHE
jgi:glutamyl-tRNA reductase